jgi:hypothetical protein
MEKKQEDLAISKLQCPIALPNWYGVNAKNEHISLKFHEHAQLWDLAIEITFALIKPSNCYKMLFPWLSFCIIHSFSKLDLTYTPKFHIIARKQNMHLKPNWQIIPTLKQKWYNYWFVNILPQLVFANLNFNRYPNSYAPLMYV